MPPGSPHSARMTELPAPAPSLFRLFSRMGGWIVLLSGVVLLVLTLISQLAFHLANRFEEEGRMATATVRERYTTTSTDSDGDTTTSHWLGFDFVTDRKEEISLTETVGTSLYRAMQVGDSFELRYLASAPETVETTPGSNRTATRVTQMIALGVGALWLIGLWVVGGWAVAAVRARRHGARIKARVTSVERSNVRVNNRPRYRLTWEDAQGRTGKSLLRKREDLSGYRPGDTIEVFQGIKHSWWVGDVGERPGG